MAAEVSTALVHTERYTGATLVQLIRDEISEPTARIFTSGTDGYNLDYWIDLGASVTSVLGLTSIQEEEIAIGATTRFEHAINGIFFKIIGAAFIDNPEAGSNAEVIYGLQKIRPQAHGGGTGPQSNANQPAKFYWVHGEGKYFNLYIIPTSETIADRVKVWGYTRVTGQDTGLLPEEMQIVPLYYALAHVYARLGKHRLSALNMSKFIEMCNSYRLNHGNDVYRVDPWSSTMIPDVTVMAQ